jgi:hypothetical protein
MLKEMKDPVTLLNNLIEMHSLARILDVLKYLAQEHAEGRWNAHPRDFKAYSMIKVKLGQAANIADENCL